jgi:hypothetical protein
MKESIDTVRVLADHVKNVYKQIKEGRDPGHYMTRLEELLRDLAEQEEIDINQFDTVNGRLCGRKIHRDMAGYRVISIAKNWPQDHHPVKVGDVVLTDRYLFSKDIGSYAYLKPSDIVAIQHNS